MRRQPEPEHNGGQENTEKTEDSSSSLESAAPGDLEAGSPPATELSLPPTLTLPAQGAEGALTVVGLGGSAGSITALQTFFENVPKIGSEGSGSAYVVVLHLSADHESHLAEVVGRSSALPVHQVTQAVRIKADTVYVIPPGKHLVMRDGTLELRAPRQTPGQRIAIDTFFRTLAAAHGPQSAAVVLSGTGADGTLGVRQIKESGGLVVAQSPSEAEYDAMPRSAIATGLVDYVLPVDVMPARIAAYWKTSRVMRIPEEVAPSPEQRVEAVDQEAALQDILTHVRAQTGHDFAYYKRATVLRRIGRRMQVNGLETLLNYRDFLRSHTAEVGGLIGDLLISVTQFFRDPEAWAALERDVIPRIFAGKMGKESEVRAWVCGCATGEEAYTLAILLLEQAERMPRPPSVQVFATDMDANAISRARAGIYPETIVGDLTEERARRWFYRQDGSYQVRKEVREVVLFAYHDVLRDTPFSRLDLVTCRNLLIYLSRTAQERIFRIFHFALLPESHLMLGPSESAEGTDGLFYVTNKSYRVFGRRAIPRSAMPPLPSPMFMPDFLRAGEGAAGPAGRIDVSPSFTRVSPAPQSGFAAEGAAAFALPPFPPSQTGATAASGALREILPRYGPPVALVNEEYTIVHLSGSVSDFLRLPNGDPTLNLLELIHPDLRPELRGALFGAIQEGVEQTRIVRNAARDGREHPALPVAPAIRLTVRPVPASSESGAPGYFVVQFEELSQAFLASLRPLVSESLSQETASEAADGASESNGAHANAAKASANVARRLERENAALQRDLYISSEQYDAVTEELKASNEEMQATNEEMRSVVEELETGKEELQSVNEELSTVNFELKARVEELTNANSDLANFLGATDIATLFLDRALNVKRFTSAALDIFNLIPSDVGRPLAHVTNRLIYPVLEEDARAVIARLIPVEREVTTADGQRHFLARMLPYRSLDDRIEGVVVNFVDITARRIAEEIIRESEERLQRAINIETVGVIFFSNTFEIADCNEAFVRMSGWSRDEMRAGRFNWELFTPEEFVAPSRRALEELNSTGHSTPYEKEYIRKDGSRFWGLFACKRIGANEIVEFVTDITERKRADANLAFLAEISQDLVQLTNIDEAMNQFGAKIGRHFNASRCAFFEFNEAADGAVCKYDWHRADVPSLVGSYRAAEFYTDEFLRTLRAGETFVVRDRDADSRVDAVNLVALDTTSYIVIPVIRDKPLQFVLCVYNSEPRDWQADEIELMREITSRIGTRLERARAEAALRESQKRLRLALDASQMGTFSYHIADDRGEPDARMLELFGLPEGGILNLSAALAEMIYPDDRERYAQMVARAVDPNGDGTLNEEVRVVHPDGTLHWIVVTAQTLFTDEPPRATWMSGVAADITERKQGQEALRESDERLRIAVTAAQLATWDWNLHTNRVRWNARHFDILGLPVQEDRDVRPELFRDNIHPEDRERIAARLEQSVATARSFDAEFRIIRHDNGEVRWMAGYGAIVQTDPTGRATRISGVMSDITVRKQAERALREERFRTLSDAIPQIIWTNSPDGAADYFNRRWYEYTGLTYEQSAGPGWQAVAHPDDEPGSAERWNRALATGGIFDTEYRLRGADGKYRWFLGRNVPLKDAAGAVTGWFGTATDIEELKQAQTARQESEERFRLLVEGARDYAMFLLDSGGRITFWSMGAERVFGWSQEEAVGHPGAIIFTPEDREAGWPELEMETARAEGQVPDRRWHLRKDGLRFWADGILMRLDDENGDLRGFAKVARDATEQRRAQQTIEEAAQVVATANEELENRVQGRTQELSVMNEMRQELLRRLVTAQEEERGRISRDLHDDTGQIVTALLLGLGNLKDVSEVAEDGVLTGSLKHLQELAGEIAQKSHRLSFTLRPTDLDDIGLMGALRNYAEEWSRWSGLPVTVESVGVEEEHEERLPREIETTIYRVVQEALTNILRYAVGKGIAAETAASRVDIMVQRRQRGSTEFNVLTVVEDDGPGFDVEGVLNRPPSQRRLGIFGMQERARLAGGTLDIESTLGKGTAVYLQIPLPQ